MNTESFTELFITDILVMVLGSSLSACDLETTWLLMRKVAVCGERDFVLLFSFPAEAAIGRKLLETDLLTNIALKANGTIKT